MGGIAARRIGVGRWEQEIGAVTGVHGREIGVSLASGASRVALAAASCLVVPQLGDTVLVGCSAGEAWVLAVLDRASDEEPLRLGAPGAARLEFGGNLCVAAPSFEIHTRTWLVRAADAVLATERLSWSSARALLDLRGVQAVLGVVEAVAETVVQRVQRSCRFVEDLEQVSAGRVDIAARSTMSLHAHDMMTTADGLVKIDAEQIQLG